MIISIFTAIILAFLVCITFSAIRLIGSWSNHMQAPTLPKYDLDQTDGIPTKQVCIRYINWKGELSDTKITPRLIYWGSTTHHPALQWLMIAMVDNQDETFAMKNVQSWK